MNRDFFTRNENWYGSFYELAIEFQTSHDNVRLEQALEALWHHPNLNGHWLSMENFGQNPDKLNVAEGFREIAQNSFISLYGVFSIPEIDQQVGCLSTVVREKDGSDWLDFCIPARMLADAFSTQYPIEIGDIHPWSKVLDKYLLQMVDLIYQQTPFDLAFIGDEVSGLVNKASIISEGFENQVNVYGLNNNKTFLSPIFWDEIALDKTFEVLPSGLRWTTFA